MTILLRTFLIALALISTSLAPRCALAFPGDLDATFGTGGFVEMPSRPRARRVVGQADHAILVLAGSELLRFDPGGGLDATFGSGGSVTLTITAGNLAVQSDGMIVVAGSSMGAFAAARYDATGVLDPLFGAGGIATAAVGTSGFASAVAVQTTGAIVLAGLVSDVGSPTNVGLARFTAGGALDASFGTAGTVVTPVVAGGANVAALRLAAADALVVAGYTSDGATVLRYDAEGVIDAGFASGGIFTIADYAVQICNDAAIQPDGAIVITGFDPYETVETARITAAGALDPTFGGDGVVSADVIDFSEGAAVAIDANGKVVVAGALVTPGPHGTYTSDFALFRYTSAGAPDTGFGAHGVVRTSIADSGAIDGAALDGDRLVVAGEKGSGPHFVLGRYDVGEICHVEGPCKGGVSGKSGLQLRTDANADKNRLQWTYRKGDATTLAELGDPSTTDDYVVCIFDESGAQPAATQSIRLRPGGTCDGLKPCWSAIGDKGFRYKSKSGAPDGLTALAIKVGDAGKSAITVKGAGALLPAAGLPRALPLRVQVHVPATGACWESTYSVNVQRNDGVQFKAKSD